MKTYQLFMNQKDKFIKKLRQVDNDFWEKFNPKTLNTNNRGNWFICFVPNIWGKWKKGFGIHYSFEHYRDKNSGIDYIRLPVGVERPLKEDDRIQFKRDIVGSVLSHKIDIDGCAIWPSVGFRGVKLIEPPLVELNDNTWEKVLNRYVSLSDFNNVVADIIRKYYKQGCFTERIEFTA